jgi:branched-chain amino acid transport system permease protein/neutral amino acid transport system permease protein
MAELVNLTVSGSLTASFLVLGAIGLTITFGVLRFANIAHPDFMMLGAYSAFFFNGVLGLPFLPSALLGLCSAVLIGTAIAWIAYDRLDVRGPVPLLIVSIGVSLVLRHVVQFLFGSDFRQFSTPLQRPYVFGPVRLTSSQIATLAVAVLLVVAVHIILTRTKFGRTLRAMADNPTLCEIAGVDVAHARITVMGIAVFLAATAGILFGLNFIIQPSMGWDFLIPIFSATILGGIGNPYGAMVGALTIGVTQEWSTLFLSPVYKDVVSFAVLALCLLLRPQGLWGKVG